MTSSTTPAFFGLLQSMRLGAACSPPAAVSNGLGNLRHRLPFPKTTSTLEGVLRAPMVCPDGHRRDSVYYSILDTEWPRVKTQLETALSS